METVESVFARNVAQLRERRGHTVRSLAAILDEQGRPMHPSGVTKMENGSRHPGPADLVALAIALGVTPNRLLLPVDESKVELTPAVTATQAEAWKWAMARAPLRATIGRFPNVGKERAALDDFRRHSLPDSERLRDDHTAVIAATAVLERVRAIVEQRGKGDPAPGLRRALARLVAEVDDLIEGG